MIQKAERSQLARDLGSMINDDLECLDDSNKSAPKMTVAYQWSNQKSHNTLLIASGNMGTKQNAVVQK